ncbi:MAG: DUF4011 domain-containing protein [Candidatus Brocadiaceae bacterium]|nr:DUF4011 domain-containing protein [Candidatus Brocadiaceae bacterium]
MTTEKSNHNMNKDTDVAGILDTIRKKLLDLGGRNNLLNYKSPKKSIKVTNQDIDTIYHILVEKEKSESSPKVFKYDNLDDVQRLFEIEKMGKQAAAPIDEKKGDE